MSFCAVGRDPCLTASRRQGSLTQGLPQIKKRAITDSLSVVWSRLRRETQGFSPIKKRAITDSLVLWCGAGSNRRHKDFQSFALPTELPHHSLPTECRRGFACLHPDIRFKRIVGTTAPSFSIRAAKIREVWE